MPKIDQIEFVFVIDCDVSADQAAKFELKFKVLTAARK